MLFKEVKWSGSDQENDKAEYEEIPQEELWEDGELAAGPNIEKHWVVCEFMWPRDKMPDPMGGKRLLDYDCKVAYEKTAILKPRQIKEPGDVRPGTKKGKLDRHPIWIVKIEMPKELILNIYSGYKEQLDFVAEPAEMGVETAVDQAMPQPGEEAAMAAQVATPNEAGRGEAPSSDAS